MKEGLVLTERDFGILLDCYKNTKLLFDQMQKRHFAQWTHWTAYKRLEKLCNANYLTAHKLGESFFQNPYLKPGIIYSLTNKGLRALTGHFSNLRFRDDPSSFNPHEAVHDLLLNEVVDRLKQRFPQFEIQNSEIVIPSISSGDAVPDGIMVNSNDNKRTALELELTPKSMKRYFKIANKYRFSEVFSRVLYVIQTENIRQKLLTALPRSARSKFFFANLNEILTCPISAKITNDSMEFAV